MTECKHMSVMPDPLTGDWTCPKCLASFRQIPEIPSPLPNPSTLWQRIKLAFRPTRKVIAVPFIWSVRWAIAREHVPRPPWQPHWSNKQNPKLPLSKAKRIYTHPSNKPRITVIK